MKILLIAPLCPLPLEKGGAIRIWNIARELSKRHTVDLVCFTRDEGECRYEEQLKKVFHSVNFIQRRKLVDRSFLGAGVIATLRFVISNTVLLGKTMFSKRPLLSHLYESNEMREFLLHADREGQYDLLYAETFYSIASMRNELEHLQTKLLLIEQNIESKAYLRQSDNQSNLLLKAFMKIDVQKIELEERYFWQKVSTIGGLSAVDVKIIGETVGKNVLLLENGVDTGWFDTQLAERVEGEILFVGSLSYFANIDALKWLLDEIWPKLRGRTGLSLRIVGRGADWGLKKYVHERGAVIDESVDDIREAFQHATVLLAPIRAGSGTKYKILEAMASRLPVVTTNIGIEGIGAAGGVQIELGESTDELAAKIRYLLENKTVRIEMAESAHSFVKQKYDWGEVVSQFETNLAEIV
jgi:glycosyltransferase involved in cell wall biosynthesis